MMFAAGRTELQQMKLRLTDERQVLLQLQRKPKEEPVQTITAVRLKVEQNQLLSVVGDADLWLIGLQGA